MKNKKINTLAANWYLLIAICYLFFVTGCENQFMPINPGSQSLPDGMGLVILHIDTHGRTIMPSVVKTDIVRYSLVFQNTGNGSSEPAIYYLTKQQVANFEPIILPAGTYNLTVTAYSEYTNETDNKPVATGSKNDIPITAGVGIGVDVELTPIGVVIAPGTTGTFEWNINVTGLALATMKIEPISAEATPESTRSLLGAGNNADSLALNSGYYRVIFTMQKDGLNQIIMREILHVYQNMVSYFEYDFSEYDTAEQQNSITLVYGDGRDNTVTFYIKGSLINYPGTPAREGHRFEGWYTNNALTNIWAYSSIMRLESNLTLYAKWSVFEVERQTKVDFENDTINQAYQFTQGDGSPTVTVVADPAAAGQKSLQITSGGWNQAAIVPIRLPYQMQNYEKVTFRYRLTSGSSTTNANIKVYAANNATDFVRYAFGNPAGHTPSTQQFAHLLIGQNAPLNFSNTGQWIEEEIYFNTNVDNTLGESLRYLQGNIFLAIGIHNQQAITYLLDDITFHLKGDYNPPPPAPSLPPWSPNPPSVGAAVSGDYRNMFAEMGKTPSQIQEKLDFMWNNVFHGSGGQEGTGIYREVDGGTRAYIWDVGNNDVRSEGMSYGMMIALQMNKQTEFDKLWRWADHYMRHARGTSRQGYFAWQCGIAGNKIDSNPAPDGEYYFATALLFAANRWGNMSTGIDYAREGRQILYDMLNRPQVQGDENKPLFELNLKIPIFSPMIPGVTDASYHLSAFFEIWAEEIEYGSEYWIDIWGSEEAAMKDAQFYREAAEACRVWLREKGTHPVTGLSSEYAYFDGTADNSMGGGSSHKTYFAYDSWRTAKNIAFDYAWWARDPWQIQHANKIQTFFSRLDSHINPNGLFSYGNIYAVDGSYIHADGVGNHSPGLVAGNAVASLAATNPIAWNFLEHFWNIGAPSGRWRYYDGCIYMFSMLHLSGNFKAYYSTGPGSGAIRNSRISPSAATFDKSNAAAVNVTLTLNGNTLTAIRNGGTTLTQGTHYTVSGDTVSIYTSYLSGLPLGTATLTFDFSGGMDRDLRILIDDTSILILGRTFESAIPVEFVGTGTMTATFPGGDVLRINKTNSNFTTIGPVITLRLGDRTLSEFSKLYVEMRGVSVPSGSDFGSKQHQAAVFAASDTLPSSLGTNLVAQTSINPSTTFQTFEYNLAAGRPNLSGDIKIAFGFGSNAVTYEIAYIGLVPKSEATTPSSTISPTSVNFDKASPTPIQITMTHPSGNSLTSISGLTAGNQYAVNSATQITLNTSYLDTLPLGATTLTFVFNAGSNRTLTINVSDSRIGTPAFTGGSSATYDRHTQSSGVTIGVNLNGNTLQNVTSSAGAITQGSGGYTTSSGNVTITHTYLQSLSLGQVTLTLEYLLGHTLTFTINITDSSITNSTLSSNAENFDRGNPHNITVTMTLNGNTFTGITGLTEGTHFTRSDTTITILASYLSTLASNTTLVFTFSAGANQNLAITLTGTPPGPVIGLSYDFSDFTNTNMSQVVSFNTNKHANTTAQVVHGVAVQGSVLEVTVGQQNDFVVLPFDLGSLTLNDFQSIKITVAAHSGDSTHKTFGVIASASNTFTTSFNSHSVIASQGSGMTGAGTYVSSTINLTPAMAVANLSGIVRLGFGINAHHGANVFRISSIELIPKPDAIPNATITPDRTTFDIYPGATTDNTDITVTITPNDNTLGIIRNGSAQLLLNTDYTVSGNVVTIKASYLAARSIGATILTFEFTPGNNQTLTITIYNSEQGGPPSLTPIVVSNSSVRGFNANIVLGENNSFTITSTQGYQNWLAIFTVTFPAGVKLSDYDKITFAHTTTDNSEQNNPFTIIASMSDITSFNANAINWTTGSGNMHKITGNQNPSAQVVFTINKTNAASLEAGFSPSTANTVTFAIYTHRGSSRHYSAGNITFSVDE